MDYYEDRCLPIAPAASMHFLVPAAALCDPVTTSNVPETQVVSQRGQKRLYRNQRGSATHRLSQWRGQYYVPAELLVCGRKRRSVDRWNSSQMQIPGVLFLESEFSSVDLEAAKTHDKGARKKVSGVRCPHVDVEWLLGHVRDTSPRRDSSLSVYVTQSSLITCK